MRSDALRCTFPEARHLVRSSGRAGTSINRNQSSRPHRNGSTRALQRCHSTSEGNKPIVGASDGRGPGRVRDLPGTIERSWPVWGREAVYAIHDRPGVIGHWRMRRRARERTPTKPR